MSALGRLYRGETRIDFVGRRRVWFAISAVIIAISALLLGVRGLNFGIEFKGGLQIQAPVADEGPLGDLDDTEIVQEVRDAVAPFGVSDAQVQVAREGDDRSVIVQTQKIAGEARQDRFKDAVSDAVGAPITDSVEIGEKWGGEITRKAVRALVIFLFVILAFISWRFEWKMAFAAIAALGHDLTVTAGVYSLVGFEVTPSTVIALLTILGYSLYDTVVVFDKVKENTEDLDAVGASTYPEAANLAMNRVVMRSINTSLTTLSPVAALLFVGAGVLGAETLEDLALALLVGIIAGTYSSIFVATPLLVSWKEREPQYQARREKVRREVVAPEPAQEEEAAPVPAAPRSPRPQTVARPPARGRAGSKKARRRRRR